LKTDNGAEKALGLSDLARRLIITVVAITLLCIIISAIYYRSWAFLPFMLGALLGGAVSILKIFLLERAVDKTLAMEKGRAGNYVTLQYLFRLGLSAAALLLGALVKEVSLWGVVAGALAYQLAIYTVRFKPAKKDEAKSAKGGE